MKALIILLPCLALLAASAAPAQPAPWWLWKSKLNGKTTCAQVMQRVGR